MTDDFRAKDPRQHESAYMGWIAKLPCLACMAIDGTFTRGVHVAHLRAGSLEHDKRPTGMAEKPSDWWTLPLCPPHHVNGNASQHHVGEERFWAQLRVNPFDACVALKAQYLAGGRGYPIIARLAAAARRPAA